MPDRRYLPTTYQEFIHISRYARFDWETKKRETFPQTVERYCDFFEEHLQENTGFSISKKLKNELEQSILDLRVMPSMRALMTAGPALKRDHVAGYNCSYIPIDRATAFDEILYILCCGTGVGFSVERQFVNQLPIVADDFHESDIVIKVADSKMGWARALKELIHLLYGGQIPIRDTSGVRPAGTPLKTFGGRASGPEPLEELFEFTIALFKKAAGRKLTSVECHDLACKIADIVVVGGVRRSALISLSNLSDDRMRHAKSGEWYIIDPQRALANNSAAYTEKPDIGFFMREWLSLYESKSGERGIFNRVAAQRKSDNGRRESNWDFGTNPCGEIILRPNEFCNLSEVIIRPVDSLEELKDKVRLATIIGTFQSTLTNFRYINKRWQRNCEEERLLGVSLTGIVDHPVMNGRQGMEKLKKWLIELKETAIRANKETAKQLGISPSAAITTVKPSGTVSQLVMSGSGIHAWHSPYFLRTVRSDKKDPVGQVLKDAGVYCEDDVNKPYDTDIFYFPIKAPKDALIASEVSAIEQLELWYAYRTHWCEHNPSCTIYLKNGEWMEVGSWIYKHFDEVGGLSFLPYTEHIYKQAPYQPITEKEYKEWVKKTPEHIDWTELTKYESMDMTEGSKTLACVAGACEIL